MAVLTPSLEEARENLRLIRQTMERSTKYSTLSGWSGILVGCVALIAVLLSRAAIASHAGDPRPEMAARGALALIWSAALALAIITDFACNKWRAARVGKRVVSRLGAHIVLAAVPAFLGAAVLTMFLARHGLILEIAGVWMLSYGVAICAVGLFSVRPVSVLGAAFVLAGALTLLWPTAPTPWLMAVTFGGFHIVYGFLMGRRHGW